MEDSLKPIAEQLAFNSGLLARAFDGTTETSASSAPAGAGNSIKWLCGHIVTARGHLLALLGEKLPAPWDNVFEGALPPDAQLPPSAAIEQKIEQSARRLLRTLATTDRRTLITAPTSPFPTVENTTLAAVAFLASHESYHIGQISYARRLLELPGLVDLFMANQS